MTTYYEKNKLKFKEYYQKNKLKKLDYQKEYYQKNKEKILNYNRDYYSRPEIIKKQEEYYSRTAVKKSKREYSKAYSKIKKLKNKDLLLKLRSIKTTPEELKIAEKAALSYIKTMNNKRLYNKLQLEDIMGDAYRGLLIALHNYNYKKNNNKESYLFLKIKYYLIDCYRTANHSRNTKIDKPLLYFSCLNDDRDDRDYNNLIKAKEVDLDLKHDILYFLNIIRNYFYTVEVKGKMTGKDYYDMWYYRFFDNLLFKEIGRKYGVSEGNISLLFKKKINPLFKDICEKIQNDNPSWY